MEALGAIVFLPRDERGSSLFLDDILFDPAALWLTETCLLYTSPSPRDTR